MTRLSVFGLGYVGCVSAALLAESGHDVVGVDVNPSKLEAIRAGLSPVTEAGLDAIVASVVADGRLQVTDDAADAVARSEASLICVGTPSNRNGSLDLTAVRRVVTEIGHAMTVKASPHTVVMRSTVLPGTARDVVVPLLESASGLEAGSGFGYVSNPEFLREGSAVADFHAPAFTVIGEWEPGSGDIVAGLYSGIAAPLVSVDVETAEMVKYATNAFHALKVAFANEIGGLSKSQGVDGRTVMDILCMDRKLNISPAYLRPGFAFGGSCLPKDARALVYRARELDVEVPLLAALLPSNEARVRKAIELVEDLGAKQVGILGLSFKAGTDDVRESPMVAVIETLLGKGYDLRVYDEEIKLTRLTGTNKAFLESVIPHIASLMVDDVDEVVRKSDVLIVGNSNSRFARIGASMEPSQVLIDLVGAVDPASLPGEGYHGSGW